MRGLAIGEGLHAPRGATGGVQHRLPGDRLSQGATEHAVMGKRVQRLEPRGDQVEHTAVADLPLKLEPWGAGARRPG